MKKYYMLALMEDSEGQRQNIMVSNVDDFFQEVYNLSEEGYHVIKCIGTNNKALYTKTRCKMRVEELKDLEQKRMEHMVRLQEIYDKDPTERNLEVITSTEKLYEELEDVLVNQVGMAYARFLRANEKGDIEYTDELAIACFNHRESKIRVDSQIAKLIYTGWEC